MKKFYLLFLVAATLSLTSCEEEEVSAFEGQYTIEYFGDETGAAGLYVKEDGSLSGATDAGDFFDGSVSQFGTFQATVGDPVTGYQFSGSFTGPQGGSGTWTRSSTGGSGTWRATRF